MRKRDTVMGYETRTYFIAKCDRCGEELNSMECCDYTVYSTKSEAEEAAECCEWEMVKGELLCDGCIAEEATP